MLKKLLLGSALLSTSLFSQAGYISVIDGADMAGIEVTAYFGNGTSETQTWAATSADSGAAASSDWSLSLSGETFGNVLPSGAFDGVWVLDNLNRADGIIGLEINAAIADVFFDNVDTVEETAGSGVGRPFVADLPSVASSFSDMESAPDLFGTLNIDWTNGTNLELGQALNFFIDTDKKTVSEPTTWLVMLSGLVALLSSRRNKV